MSRRAYCQQGIIHHWASQPVERRPGNNLLSRYGIPYASTNALPCGTPPQHISTCSGTRDTSSRLRQRLLAASVSSERERLVVNAAWLDSTSTDILEGCSYPSIQEIRGGSIFGWNCDLNEHPTEDSTHEHTPQNNLVPKKCVVCLKNYVQTSVVLCYMNVGACLTSRPEKSAGASPHPMHDHLRCVTTGK